MIHLTAPEVKNATSAYRFIVELYSLQVDRYGTPVDYDLLDVLVCDPTQAGIEQLLESKGYSREQWQLVDYWMPCPEDPF